MEALPRDGELTSAPGAAPAWHVVELAGHAAALHAREPAADVPRSLWWCCNEAPALVLGSAQPVATIDLDACASAGIEVARRRSGGGAVLMLPGEAVWVDALVPRGDPLWDDDVGHAMWWLGAAWARALGSVGIDAEVHRGGLVRGRWSSVVCFDGLGPGEVTVEGAKAVGISQRRTRHWARLQSVVHLRWRPEVHAGLLADRPAAAELRRVWTAPVSGAELRAAFERAVGVAPY